MKKISLCLAIALIMAMVMPMSAFASENDMPEDIPEYAERHEVTIEVPSIEEDEGNGVAPCLWDEVVRDYGDSNTHMVATFSSTCSYAAYETSAVVIGGSANGMVRADFRDDGASIRTTNVYPNGNIAKDDYIPLNNHSTYTITVANYTGATVRITVTYYTW